jgi:hypothetical protein
MLIFKMTFFLLKKRQTMIGETVGSEDGGGVRTNHDWGNGWE